MLKKILAISGRPGLYKLVSHGNNIVVVESVVDGKRGPAHSRDRIVALGDISIYTTDDDKPLGEVLQNAYKVFDGKPVDKKNYKTAQQLQDVMKEILPNFDVDRVHNSDIKKLLSWYNILVEAGFTEFTAKEEDKKDTGEQAEKESEA